MQRLRAYVRRTVLEKAREYAGHPRRTHQSTRDAFIDAMRGTDTGWWNDLIYTADILDRFSRNRAEVRNCILDFLAETGATVDQAVTRGPNPFTYAELIAATGRRQTWANYNSESERRAREADAACFALSFAVEYLAGELARDYAPEL